MGAIVGSAAPPDLRPLPLLRPHVVALLRAHLVLLGAWDPAKHPKHPAGTGDVVGDADRDGGKFAPSDGGGSGSGSEGTDSTRGGLWDTPAWAGQGTAAYRYPPETDEEVFRSLAIKEAATRRLVDKFHAEHNQGGTLTPELRSQYAAHFEKVCDNIPTPALVEISKNVDSVYLYGSQEEMNRHLGTTDVGAYVRSGPNGIMLGLDGGPNSVAARGYYAHEIGHALDRDEVHSRTPEWRNIWKAELAGGSLSKYATTNPEEGFAEFMRLLGSGKSLRDVAEDFPHAYNYFTRFGWVTVEAYTKRDGTRVREHRRQVGAA